MSTVEERLAELGLTVPEVVPPVASYQPAVLVDKVVYVSGQLPLVGGELPAEGRVGAEVTHEQAYEMAKQCGLNLIAALKTVVDLDSITRIAKVGGFVASAPDFKGQPQVINGASEVLGQAFGDAGIHARSAVGVLVLPLNTPVEVDLIAHIG
ncbi:RidA family protein [Nesterenkonia natronophila]|uniref:RidA family protein n=1 Tax=Nesterenkonia natronophila TaxID=2174932 RepID=A0A3A4F3Y3_9MICC|nr:RidA family protein [Nesterenkonia natronophila]RJN32568.1 RidA family protein [Nesterenkonia natronophila]